MNIDPIHADLRTAIHIKKALDRISNLQKLGYCPTKVQQFREYFDLDDGDVSTTDEEECPGSTTSKAESPKSTTNENESRKRI